ncbi:DUF5689 domain-containing protein [Alistipes putredinis]|uniref:DUF5689 domain-containing protein n=1 Tax=Alistipes putredinis TaxID=28117 RepID=UPI00242EBE65|nr:DUF5689 domain-containing protein [Alistipes putredinis]
MKKSSIWKLLFSALTVFAVAVFAGCTDDNDDMGAPYLNVTPENLTFDAEGQPADEYNGTFIVETNRPWRAIVEDEQTWVRLSATEGEGDAAVTVTVPASNIGQSAKVTFEVYNSYGALIQKDVNVLQGEVVPPDPGEATAITIPELIAQMTDTEAPVDANADRYLDAVVMNDVAGANYTFNNLILATENATEAGNGITLYGSQVEPSTLGLNKGDKVRVTLYKGLAKVVNYSGMYEVTGAKEATWCKVEKTGTVTSIPTATIAAADLAKYQGMAVTIANASVAQAGVWASASALSSHTFTADGANFTVFCKQSDEKNPSVFLDVPFKAGSGNISGLAAVYKNNSQLVPRNLDDVAAFSDSSTPMITGVTPASVSIPAIGGNETIIVSVANKGENVLSVSGLSGLLEATVDNANNMVTVTAQPNTGAVQNQTLTIAIAGGNSVTVPVTLLGVGGGGTGEVVAFSITDIKADNADLPTNGYGSQVVATPSTWVSWTVGGIEFTGVKICESPASNGSIIQMQGNDSDAAKQAKLQNVTPIDGMSKIKIVFRSYPNKSGSYYNPGYTMTVAGAAQTPVETYTDKSGYREYVHEYDLAGLGADSFVLDNNKVGALYIESFEITK